MQPTFHLEVGILRIRLNDQFMTAQMACHPELVYRRTQIATDLSLPSIKSDAFTNTFKAALAPHMEHHLESDHITVLFHYIVLFIVFVESAIFLWVE